MDELLLISFPHQLLHAVSALRHDRMLNGQAPDAEVTVFVWAYQPNEHLPGSRFRALFRKLLVGLPWVRLAFPGYPIRQLAMSPHRSIAQRVRYARQSLGAGRADRVRLVGYAHDAGADHTAQVLLQSFPGARALCFGDPPGFLYTPEEILRSAQYLPSPMKTLFGHKAGADAGLKWRFADANTVTIHFQATARKARQDAILVPTALVLSTLRDLCTGLEAERIHQKRFMASLHAPRAPRLFLLSNFSESKIVTRKEDELEIYRGILRQHAREDDVVVVKPHVGSTPGMAAELARTLPNFRLVCLPHRLQWLPVEMLDVLVRGSHCLSVSSASVLLKLLYGDQIASHALTDDIVDRYFVPDWKLAYRDVNRLMIQAIEEIAQKIKIRSP